MAIRTRFQALAAIRSLAFRKANISVGNCQRNAHEIYNIPTDGTPTAAAAWAKAKYRHTMVVEPPRGAFVYWTGGSSGAGHVAIYAGRAKFNPLRPFRKRARLVWSPGAPTATCGPGADSRWVKCKLHDIPTGWPGHVLVGWTEDIDGVRVPGLAPRA